jgi:hypothetical protein
MSVPIRTTPTTATVLATRKRIMSAFVGAPNQNRLGDDAARGVSRAGVVPVGGVGEGGVSGVGGETVTTSGD